MPLKSNPHEPRLLPVIALVDASGSMAEHGKIQALNLAVREMLAALATESQPDLIIKCAVISFSGAGARLHTALTPPAAIDWADLEPSGDTPLGAALDELVRLGDDRTLIPANSFSPTLLLVSDGLPTDDYEAALGRFQKSSVGQRSVRLAIRIGPDADVQRLASFTGSARQVLHAADAAEIDRHFRFVTYSVMEWAQSAGAGSSQMPLLHQFGSSSGPEF